MAYVNEKRNHQHDHKQFDFGAGKRGQHQIADTVPEVQLNKQRRDQLDDHHQTNVNASLIQPRFLGSFKLHVKLLIMN